jgi:hypothetical protein
MTSGSHHVIQKEEIGSHYIIDEQHNIYQTNIKR